MKPNPRKTNKLQSKPTTPPVAPRRESVTQPAPTEQPRAPEPASHVFAEQKQNAPSPTAVRTVEVGFSLFQPNAHRVAFCSEANGWSPEATPMRRSEDGNWRTTLALRPGRYEYKFFVDGEWIPDPKARENVPNQYGSTNSVIVVRA